jgi:hypothetical protein
MKKQLLTLNILFFLVVLGTVLFSCKHKIEEDQDLYLMSKSTENFVWYKNSSTQLSKSAGSGHSQPFLNTRFNSVAQSNLDANFKVKIGQKFPEKSLIVKELYENGKLDQYAILYKNSSHKNADSKGWVWGYINSDGSVKIPSSKKGESCASCHSQSGNEDYMLMNKYYP